ncbi:MAG: carboxypeptidase-like regulatory domain-containing protein [Bacteroidetes bacterium]|nr:carboxypeptidase-like regulatory domain-containing protein [Bacteroidota bacterium]
MRKLLPWIFLLLFQPLFGQEPVMITGKVADSATGNPLSFTAISLQHSVLGTTTNEDGIFQINIPSVEENDSLVFYFLGYETRRIAVKKGAAGPLEVLMKPVSLQLSEVEIIGLTPQEVIRRAVANIPSNYGKDSLILTAFIRSQKLINNKLAEYTEAIIGDLKTGYFLYKKGGFSKKHETSNVPHLLKGRVTSDTNLVNAMGDAGRNVGCLGCNFINDIVEFYHNTILDESLFKYYDLRMEEMIPPEGGKIYHISYAQKPAAKERLWKGELFIDAGSFAVMKITQKPSMNAYEAYEKTKYNRSFTILSKPGWIEEMPFIQQTIVYSRRDSTWYLNSIRTENWLTFTQFQSGQKIKISYKNDVVVTDATRDPAKVRSFEGDKIMGTAQRWDQIIGPPDPSFWAHFNFLPVEETLKKSVEGMKK